MIIHACRASYLRAIIYGFHGWTFFFKAQFRGLLFSGNISKYVFERLNVKIPAWFATTVFHLPRNHRWVLMFQWMRCSIVWNNELLAFMLQQNSRVKPFLFNNNDYRHDYCNSYGIDATVKQVMCVLDVSFPICVMNITTPSQILLWG